METLKSWITDFPLGVFLGFILLLLFIWWWMNRQISHLKAHTGELGDRINFLEGELEACRKSKVSVESTATIAGVGLAVGAVGVAGGAGSKKKDDLKIVEGIGPKIEELFNNAGIYTFAQLSDTSVEKMKSILEAAGSRFVWVSEDYK